MAEEPGAGTDSGVNSRGNGGVNNGVNSRGNGGVNSGVDGVDSASDSPSDSDSDADLLRRHVAGDPLAFATLFRRHRDRLWALALRTLGDREEAADALQEAMLAAHRGAAGFRGEAAATSWLHRIVVNACLDRARRNAARSATPLDPRSLAEAVASLRRDSAAHQAPERAEHAELLAALRGLPAEQAAAVVLVHLEGYSVAEAASMLQVAEGTVKSRCARGRARLAVTFGSQAAARNRSAAGDVPSPTPRHSDQEDR